MKSAPPTVQALFADQSGVVLLEFLVTFVPVWTFCLCIFQLALIAEANLMVKHAADAAARSASVVLPDDPNEYGGEPEMSVGRNRVTGDGLVAALGRASAALRAPSSSAISIAFSDHVLGNVGRSRLNTIRLAAHIPLMPLAPVDVGRDARPSLQKALGGRRSPVSAVYYQPFAVAVTFPGTSGELVTAPEVTVRVSYAFQCTVPLARRILCSAFDDLEGEQQWKQSFVTIAQGLVGGRFRRLHHEATLMVHRAPYEYRPRGS
jgi:hypothetical protein